MRIAPTITLTEQQRDALDRFTTSRTVSVRLAQRARIVLLAAAGKQDLQIAAELGITRQKAGRWRERYLAAGVAGIERDAPRPGRFPKVSNEKTSSIIRKTTQETPAAATHWSLRRMAHAVGTSQTTVHRIWKRNGLKPHLTKTFKLSRDKRFVEKLEDIIGLYLSPPEHAIVLSCDEKSQIQALDRTQPGLPMKKGRLTTLTHDYKRNGTTTLFAALNTLEGTVISTCQQRHRHQEWLKFLKLIDAQTPPDKELHLIVDNYSTHKHIKVRKWLSRHPRFHIHFTPTSASWLNMVERFFRDLTCNSLRRGVFKGIPELINAIEDHINHHNQHPKPFIWTAKAADILEKVKRAQATLNKLQTA